MASVSEYASEKVSSSCLPPEVMTYVWMGLGVECLSSFPVLRIKSTAFG